MAHPSSRRTTRFSVGVKQQQYVWVSNDLIESAANSKKLRIRKRNRSYDDWGWCRAAVVSSDGVSGASSSSRKSIAPRSGSPAVNKSLTIRVADEIFAPADADGSLLEITYNADDNLVFQCNDWWKIDNGEAPEDLTELEQLHEQAVVYCLHHRYQNDVIYTYTGKILLALNPFRPLELYGEEVMQRYWHSGRLEGRPTPHIYAIAEDAYRSAVDSLERRSRNGDDQSILVSGESGAGKTVTTKIILQYFAVLSQQSDPTTLGIESQVLESNPILESFGNARTIRNDNSSRFGKLMELLFDRKGCLLSASIQTYLLEKVRLISQSPGERNYHIFYEILVGLTHRESRRLRLSSRGPRDFRLTCSSGTFDRRDGIQDRDTYAQLIEALDTVGFTREEQMNLFTVVSALLYTSNLTFVEEATDASILDSANPSLAWALELLGVDVEVLNAALCTCAIEARGEILYKHLPIDRAEKAVDALIKATYSALFNHIVLKINSFMTKVDRVDAHGGSQSTSTATIAVLDIFGFESFDQNSFEQLCINFCNEALQQQFNRFVFKLEQEEYKKEGIDWAFITFPDNQDVLDLIEKRHDGILSILDEQSRLPRCTDATFANAVYQKCSGHRRFETTKSMKARLTFAIHHYAGLVEYDSDCFLEKNKDELSKETTMLLRSSALPFFVQLGTDLAAGSSAPSPPTPVQKRSPGGVNRQLQRGSSSIMRESVGLQFCNQLRMLRTRIDATNPHYVRCLKPNDELHPHSFNALVIADQLRCAGVIEAIRVSRVGFPHRYSHDHFVQRYGLLEPRELTKQAALGSSSKYVCEILVDVLNRRITNLFDEETTSQLLGGSVEELVHGVQLGKTKVFLRRLANEALEFLRRRVVEKSAIRIQSMARMFLARNNYEIATYAITLIQKFFRQLGANRLMRQKRIENSACILQRFFRCCKSRRELRAAISIALWCQSATRGAIARQYCAYLFLDQKASCIQRAWRHYAQIFSGSFARLRSATITLQNRFRSRKACRELWKLRSEAKDLARIAAERDKFKEESRRLRKELEKALVSPAKPAQPINPEVEKLRSEVQLLQDELEKSHKMASPSESMEARKQDLAGELDRKEEELRNLRREIAVLRSRDDRSTSIKSMLIEMRQNTNTSVGSFSNSQLRGSPARSDVSLLDDEDEPVIDDVSSITSIVRPDDTQEDELRQLHSAVRQRSRRHLESVLTNTEEACILVNQGDRYGRTAVHLAVLSLDTGTIAKLIEMGAVVNTQDDDGETPLHLAEDANMTMYLLNEGKANPNIPNVDGICALHLAVQRRDIESVRALVENNANVNNADNIRWFTALHLIALPSGSAAGNNVPLGSRCHIARLLTETPEQSSPDLNYQDSEGNTPLHYGVQLDTPDTCELVTIFLEKNADPNISNSRDQVPLHLLCHNSSLRQQVRIFRQTINSLLIHGANPSSQSMTGCTPLHLCLYHKDIATAIQLVRGGAQLHCVWKKPKKWKAFWDEKERGVVALDMVVDHKNVQRILAAVSTQQKPAPPRNRCMECKTTLRSFSRTVHCGHCGRLLCGKCSGSCLPPEFFPKNFKLTEPGWACGICEKVLMAQKDVMSSSTHPTSSYGDDDDDDHYSC